MDTIREYDIETILLPAINKIADQSETLNMAIIEAHPTTVMAVVSPPPSKDKGHSTWYINTRWLFLLPLVGGALAAALAELGLHQLFASFAH